MKKVLCTLVLGLTGCTMFAITTQQGIVKTKGRLNNDGTVMSGERLSEAYVTVQGAQTVKSNTKGEFNISLTSKEYYLKDVNKEGYILCDADALSHKYTYSATPMYIVMETPTQQMEDQLLAERQLRRTLQRQLQEREEEIDSLKAQQQISEEEYRQQLQKIYAEQEENERLIKEMADRYASIDYDQLDEFNRQIRSLILEGRLTEADSLIRSKGDISSRVESLKEHQEKNNQEEQALKKRMKALEKSKAYTQKELEDLAQDCYSLYEILKMQHINDSAAYYLELRASLDTTNVEWQLAAGDFYKEYIANLEKAESLYQKAYENLGFDSRDSSLVYNSLGGIAIEKGEFKKGIYYQQKALEIQLAVIPRNYSDIASTYSELGTAYFYLEDLDSADICFEYDIKFTKQLYGEKHPKVAQTYMNMAEVKSERGDYKSAIAYYKYALEIFQDQKTSDKMQLDIASAYNNMGVVFRRMGEYGEDNTLLDTALCYLKQSLEIRKSILGETHPLIAATYNNLSNVYDAKNDYSKSLEYSLMDIQITKAIFGEEHPDLAISYGTVALVYKRMKNYELSMEYNMLALQMKLKYFPKISTTVGGTYNNIGTLYYAMGEYELSKQYLTEAYEIMTQIVGPEHGMAIGIKKRIEEVEKELQKP